MHKQTNSNFSHIESRKETLKAMNEKESTKIANYWQKLQQDEGAWHNDGH